MGVNHEFLPNPEPVALRSNPALIKGGWRILTVQIPRVYLLDYRDFCLGHFNIPYSSLPSLARLELEISSSIHQCVEVASVDTQNLSIGFRQIPFLGYYLL